MNATQNTVYGRLKQAVTPFPDKIAVHWQGQKKSYAELFSSSEVFAVFLCRQLHVTGKRVGLIGETSAQYLVASLALQAACAAEVPLASEDIEASDGELLGALGIARR